MTIARALPTYPGMRNTLWLAITMGLLSQAVADPHRPPRKGEHQTQRDDDGFGEFNGHRWLLNDCNASFEAEVDVASAKAAYAGLSGLGSNYPWEEAVKDSESICHTAMHALERVCDANRHRGDTDARITDGVKLVRCTIVDPKQGVKESFADGTWTIAVSLWTTDADLANAGGKLASALGVRGPQADESADTSAPPKRCSTNRDCASGSTCFASMAHGPRCFTAADLAPPVDDSDDGGGSEPPAQSHTSSSKTKTKKGEGESCTYTSECESRPGMRCARPRGAALKVHTTCMRSGY